MRARTEYFLRLRPWSPRAFLAAAAILTLAAGVQEMFVLFGMPLYFSVFFPAILLASLVAGAPAGIFAMLFSVPLVWWAFIPPYFEFGPLAPEEYDRIVMFVLGSSLVISFANLCREALLLLRK